MSDSLVALPPPDTAQSPSAGDPAVLMLSNGLALPRPRQRAHAGFRRMSYEAYDQVPALRRSLLDKIRVSPAHLQHYLEHGDEDTAALTFGRALHTMILEPEKTEAEVCVFTGAVRRGKAWDEFKAANAEKTIVTVDEMERLQRMRDSFYRKALTRNLLRSATVEACAFWKDEPTGLDLKARLDIFKTGAVYDLKSTSDISFEAFQRAAFNFGYHRQGDWYGTGATAVTGEVVGEHFVIAAEKKDPYEIRVFRCSDDFIARGAVENRENLNLYARCKASGLWTAPEIIEELELPRWVQ